MGGVFCVMTNDGRHVPLQWSVPISKTFVVGTQTTVSFKLGIHAPGYLVVFLPVREIIFSIVCLENISLCSLSSGKVQSNVCAPRTVQYTPNPLLSIKSSVHSGKIGFLM